MNIQTVGKFLIGRREAILDICNTRNSIWVGLLFVVSAGFAREYDGEDLLHEPWYLLIPIVASFVSATGLFFVLVVIGLIRKQSGLINFGLYRKFLSLFWMTAPLAWLYGIPYERFLSEADATRANLWTLAIVAAWRVALIMRCASIVFGWKVRHVFWPVALYCVVIFGVVMEFMPLPVPLAVIMGGIRQTEAESVIRSTILLIRAFCLLGFPLFAFGSFVILFMDRTKETPSTGEFNGVVRTSLWVCGLSSIAVSFLVLPSTQPQQINRYHAERMLYAGEIREAIRFMSTKQRTDFPPFWDVPPRIFLAEKVPNLFDAIGVLNSEATTADWVRGSFVDKLIRFYRMGPVRMETPRLFEIQQLSNMQLESLVTLLNTLPEGPMIAYGICESDGYAFDEQGNDDIEDGTVGERALLDSANDPVRIGLIHQLKEISDRYDARTGGSL